MWTSSGSTTRPDTWVIPEIMKEPIVYVVFGPELLLLPARQEASRDLGWYPVGPPEQGCLRVDAEGAASLEKFPGRPSRGLPRLLGFHRKYGASLKQASEQAHGVLLRTHQNLLPIVGSFLNSV